MTGFSFEEAAAPAPSGGFSFEDATKPAPKIAYGDMDKNAGIAEGGAALLSGAVAAPIAGLSGMAAAFAKALGITDTEAADVVRKVQAHLTYEPRSQTGQKVAGLVAAPFEALAGVADKAGEKVTDLTGSPALGAATNTAIQSVPAVVGKVPKLAAKIAPELVSKLNSMEEAAKVNRAKIAALEAPVREGIEGAHAAGYVITPDLADASIVSKNVESIAGSELTQKLASKKNAATTNELARLDVGVDADAPISRDALAKIRTEEGKAYEAVKRSGAVENDAKYFADIDKALESRDTAATSYEHRQAIDDALQRTVDGLRKAKSVDAAAAIEEVKLLRQDADKAYAARDKALGNTYRKLAQAIDDSIDRHLKTNAPPELADAVDKYRAARERIAKTYLADKALNDTTGNIDARVYAKALKKGDKLSGAGLQIARFAQQFEKLAQDPGKLGPSGIRFTDVLMAGLSKEALLAGARPIARHALLSKPAQAVITTRAETPTIAGTARAAADLQATPAVVGAEMGAEQRRKRAEELRRSLGQ